MNWSDKRVLVTGAGGFIGSHLTERLVQLGARTRAFVHYNSAGSRGWLDSSPHKKDIEFIAGDIRDADSVKRGMWQTEIVFHLAALIGIPYSYDTPLAYVRTNVEGTLNVLQTALDAGADLVVHTSTSEVYGTARYIPIDEAHPLNAQSPYSATKIGADSLVEAFHHSFALPVCTVRPFNTYGPRQSARAIIPAIIIQTLNQPAISLGNLTPLRDLTYVADTVASFIKMVEYPAAIGQLINIGFGQEISIADLAKTILQLVGRDIPIVSEQQRTRPKDSEVERLCADNRKAQQLIGWQPTTTLTEGLKQTIEWLQTNQEWYRADDYAV